MKKIYERPIVEIEKFDEETKVATASDLNVSMDELMGL